MRTSQGIYDYVKTYRKELEAQFGAKMPVETELARILDTDRYSLRRAMKRLRDDGIVYQVKNKGYFLNLEHLNIMVNSLTTYTRNCTELKTVPRSKILEANLDLPSEEIRKELGLEKETWVWNIYFLRYHKSIPLCLTRSFLPYEGTQGLITHLKTEKSLYRALGTFYKLYPKRVKSECLALAANRDEAKFLDLPLGYPLLGLNSTAVDQNNKPIEYCRTLYRSDVVSLTFLLDAEMKMEDV